MVQEKDVGTALTPICLMTVPISHFSDALDAAFIRTDVHHMSRELLGIPYSRLQVLIYPRQPYKSFTITKRSGALRFIDEPRRRLKVLQEKFLAYLYEHAGIAKSCVHGFTRKRSIVTNAKRHCSSKTQHLLNIDIENFFPSITFYRMRGLFQKKPFEFSYEVATVLAQLCTYNGTLPQGAPTSPLLANLVCRSLDRDLMKLAERHRATYTRYADDITFSFSVRRAEKLPANICSFDSGILTLGDEIQALFASHSFRINPNKSRLSSRLSTLEVTGITINEFPNVKRIFIDRIRGALRAWETHGYDLAKASWEQRVSNAQSVIYEKRLWKRQWRSGAIPALKNVLRGKLLYLRMVRGAEDALYSRLAERYNALCAREEAKGHFVYSRLPVDDIVRNAADAKEAIFVIEWTGDYRRPGTRGNTEMVGGQGTAFVYKDVGLITCDHVLRFSGCSEIDGEPIDTDVQSGDVANAHLTVINIANGNSWPVKIAHWDAHHDLAVIQFDVPTPPAHRHFIGMGAPIGVSKLGVLIGFPNYSVGKSANFLNGIVLNRFPRSALNRIEISASIRQGNSGGPFVDQYYRLAGVAQQGAKQDGGNDECLCVTDLDKWLDDWKAPST